MGVNKFRLPIRRISCWSTTAWIKAPADKNNKDLKNAWLIKWNKA